MNQNLHKKSRSSRRGFTILIAVLVASIAVSLGAAIFAIVSKEIALSSIGSDSQFAFYAADTVAECALYWDERADIHPNTFATSSADQNPLIGTAPEPVTCDGVAATGVSVQSAAYAATTTFEIANLFESPAGDASSGYCADVTVAKLINPDTNVATTTITANGFNVPCAEKATAQTALERSVELQN